LTSSWYYICTSYCTPDREIDGYLVHWKGFTVENNTWEKGEDLGNAKELVDKFEGRLNMEVR